MPLSQTMVGAGVDPIIGQMPPGGPGKRPFLGAAHGKTTKAKPSFDFQPWVQMKGGAYFFAPSLEALSSL